MNFMDLLAESGGENSIGALSKKLGLEGADAGKLVEAVAPALMRGLQKQTESPDAMAGLTKALSGGGHQRYLDDPTVVDDDAALADGNKILGHLFGSKDVSRQVASHAASTTGLDSGILKKMLPMVATMVMGSMSKQAASSSLPGGSDTSGASGLLMQLLDSDKDGSVMDDIIGLAGKFMR